MHSFKRPLISGLIEGAIAFCVVVGVGSLLASGISPTAYQTVQDEAVNLAQRTTLNFIGAGVACADGAGKTTCTIPGGVTSAYDTIQEEGVSLTQRSILNFIGASVTCVDSGGVKTNCTFAPFYQTVEDEGVGLTQRTNLNFTGSGVTCSDSGGKTVCNIDGATANQNVRSFGAGLDGAGNPLTTANVAYTRVPFGCTITGYSILATPAGTMDFDVWKIASGTALPTVANTIISGTSYLAISTGTAVDVVGTTSFTTTTVTAKDMVAFKVHATSSVITQAQVIVLCNAT